MSASAVKSSMPGVGTSPTSQSHSMLPMTTMAQKVVPGTDSSSIKPLSGTGISYTTLQPPTQPLSLIQDHRPSVYQTPPYVDNSEKEPEAEKIIPNGVESVKEEPQSKEQENPEPTKLNDSNRNNSSNVENLPVEEEKHDEQKEPEITSPKTESPASSVETQSTVEEKSSPVNNGTKESEDSTSQSDSSSTPTKTSPLKTEDIQSKTETPPKAKSVTPNSKSSTSSFPTTSPSSSDNTAVVPASGAVSSVKPEIKTPSPPKVVKRKSRELKDLKGHSTNTDEASKPKRNRTQVQPYQSPLPEMALLVKTLNKPTPTKAPDDKLIVFYKNEFLAVRNAEGSFFVCQAMQNIYKTSKRIRIRWLSQDKNNGEIYSPDFYDYIDFDCILTNLNLNKIDKNKYQLTKIELLRTENILKRAIDVEAGVSEKPRVTEEHPDGLDLSLYKDESQLKKRKGTSKQQRQSLRKKPRNSASTSDDDATEEESDKKLTKSNRSKKQSVNKTLALAKSVAKGPSRAERAMNRSSKNNNNNSGSEVISSTTNAAADGEKSIAETKKNESKKTPKTQSNNVTNAAPKTKRSSQDAAQGSNATGRPKRVSASTGTTSNEEAATRKKSRSRA